MARCVFGWRAVTWPGGCLGGQVGVRVARWVCGWPAVTWPASSKHKPERLILSPLNMHKIHDIRIMKFLTFGSAGVSTCSSTGKTERPAEPAVLWPARLLQ